MFVVAPIYHNSMYSKFCHWLVSVSWISNVNSSGSSSFNLQLQLAIWIVFCLKTYFFLTCFSHARMLLYTTLRTKVKVTLWLWLGQTSKLAFRCWNIIRHSHYITVELSLRALLQNTSVNKRSFKSLLQLFQFLCGKFLVFIYL